MHPRPDAAGVPRMGRPVVGLRADDRYLVVPPFFHSFGYKSGWLASLMVGATVLPQMIFDVNDVVARIPRDRVTILPGPPTLYQSILSALDSGTASDFRTLRLAVTGAAVVPVELVHRMRRQIGFETVLPRPNWSHGSYRSLDDVPSRRRRRDHRGHVRARDRGSHRLPDRGRGETTSHEGRPEKC